MAQHDNVFSLTDIKKKADKIQIFDERTIDEEGKAIPFVDQMALVTHYLQMRDLRVEIPYAQKAEDILDSWCDFATGGKAKEQVQDVVREGGMALQQYLFPELFQVRFPAQENPSFTFIDLFAGIGGFRMAFQNLGGKCVFSSEWDEQAKKTYYANYGEVPFGDITKESTKNLIPKQFDVLCAGFPCQAFSIAGYRKGFEDTRGTLFFDVAEIIRRHRPKAVFLENVKNLKAHDKGNTFKVIKQTLEDMNYVVYEKVMNAMDYANVPQNRERIFIIIAVR
ncbi:MAG: DNA cytosine methyltransferase [Bacteroidales bacterium]|nr:DNA cytosine methyltransferase [Bacteroidales bacterium]